MLMQWSRGRCGIGDGMICAQTLRTSVGEEEGQLNQSLRETRPRAYLIDSTCLIGIRSP